MWTFDALVANDVAYPKTRTKATVRISMSI